ncbi:porphobilinogen synthase [Ahrensia sp. R2A130]|uniref:porphobilinogen synthase n=1 Tax=Ahrensia sp. R2A130 TaxID=744979 RepID=UPI0001E08C0A|nr:porphobilinogen synthase [Ahrensia sp. R2A130]EFL90537.1 delta-aminolevulinic acid dehydratase [Ahrensia sp. R2A130]
MVTPKKPTDTSHLIDELTGSSRLRRTRRCPWMRAMVAEARLSPADLILPIFLIEGEDREESIDAMPGVSRFTIDHAVLVAKKAASLGIPLIAPFPNVALEKRDTTGSEITNPDNIICEFIRAVKAAVPEIGVMTDAALDPFTDHGHDGVLRDGEIVNDESVEQIVAGALVQAEAGADIIAPSDMMDGRIGAIRVALDEAGYQDVAIMSYTAKYASGFYGPYREAIGTEGLLQGDKKTYYIDPANSEDAMREAQQDIDEGADMLMVKPGMPYLDIVRRMKDEFSMPVFAYQVSGEYTMIELAAAAGVVDGDRVRMESLIAFKRAGADGILTYHAMHIAEKLNAQSPAIT